MSYTFSSGILIAHPYSSRIFPWLIHDGYSWQDKEHALTYYLSDACLLFLKEAEKLGDLTIDFTEKDEERLIFMLRSLIDARKSWQHKEELGTSTS